jgi:hypothetical protein
MPSIASLPASPDLVSKRYHPRFAAIAYSRRKAQALRPDDSWPSTCLPLVRPCNYLGAEDSTVPRDAWEHSLNGSESSTFGRDCNACLTNFSVHSGSCTNGGELADFGYQSHWENDAKEAPN